MNKVLVLAEERSMMELFRGLFAPSGLHVCKFTSGDTIRIENDDDIIVICPADNKSSIAQAIQRIREQVSDLKVVCFSNKKSASFRKQFSSKEIDIYFTDRSTIGEIEKKVWTLPLPERHQDKRTEVINQLIEGQK
jgi:hypothetical protein